MADSIELFSRKRLNPLFAFTFSDEISFFFYEMPTITGVEKIDSIILDLFFCAYHSTEA